MNVRDIEFSFIVPCEFIYSFSVIRNQNHVEIILKWGCESHFMRLHLETKCLHTFFHFQKQGKNKEAKTWQRK
jgi:hypothetical protein